MLKRMNEQNGFTLIELMIVVAIIGILASIAIPNFLSMQLRAKRSEVPTNMAAIRTAEQAYFHEYDSYTTVADNPGKAVVSTHQQSWLNPKDWDLLGFKPDGKVRGSYAVGSTKTQFTVTGICDVDGDGTAATFKGNETIKPEMNTANNIY